MPRFRTLAHVGLTSLLAILTASLAAGQPTPALPAPAAPPTASSHTQTKPAPLQSAMDAQLLYQLLVSELNALPSLGGSKTSSYSLMLDAARRSGDERLFKRALDLAVQTQRAEPALAAAAAWRSAHPRSPEAHLNTLRVLLALDRIADTLAPLRAYLAVMPANERPSFIAQIPQLFARFSDKKLAALTAEQALSEQLKTPSTAALAWAAIGRMRLAASEPAAAMIALTQGRHADSTAIEPLMLALDLLRNGLPAAEQTLLDYLKKPKSATAIHMVYLQILIDSQRMRDALKQIQAITRDHPDLSEGWATRGTLAIQFKQFNQAEMFFNRVIELNRNRADSPEKRRELTHAHLALAEVFENRRDFAQAESWLEKIDPQQSSVDVHFRRASILAKQGRISEARNLIRHIPQHSADHADLDERAKLLAEARLLADHKEYAAAYELLQPAVQIASNDAELIHLLASVAEKLGRHSEMELLLRQVIALQPTQASAYNFLGYFLADRNTRLSEARVLLQKANDLSPDDPAVTDSLGWLEFRLGNLSRALILLGKAHHKYPSAEIGAHFGEALWVSGQRDRAMSVWRESLVLDPDDAVLRETLQRLRVRL